MSCLGCQHFISDWLGKLKPNKLSTGCQRELKGPAVEKATNPGRQFLFFLRPLMRPGRQNYHATQATRVGGIGLEGIHLSPWVFVLVRRSYM